MIYNLSNCMQGINRFFNKTVLPHSLGPAIIHLRFSGNVTSTVILLSVIHGCRLPLTLINKFPFYSLLMHRALLPLGSLHVHIVNKAYLFVWLESQGLCPFGVPRTESVGKPQTESVGKPRTESVH